MERKLAAILAADVVGYSRLMAQDEAGTLQALKTLRTEVIDPKIAENKGRVFKATGDGVLAEFPSVVNAVSCAVEIQRAMTGQALQLRIGVHLGDVIVEDGDIFGDGVNLAARIEGVAPPGGIALSASAFEHVGNRLGLAFDDMGEQSLKNIDRPVKVYSVRLDGVAAVPPAKVGGLSLPEKPSIAVLPFTNMSADPEQEFFTDGLTEDIITDLSNVSGFFVIARNSTFAYKAKPTDVRQIARDLGVKYILEGSARRSDKRLRVNVQLINALEGGNHVWAERFDREFADIFEVQDEVTRRVVQAISGKIGTNNILARSRPSNLEAYDLCVRSRYRWSSSKEDNREARLALERALVLDPSYCEAHSNLALCLLFGWITWGVPQVPDRKNALQHALRAVEIEPTASDARSVLAFVRLYDRNLDDAKTQFDAAIRLNPNNADAMARMAELHIYMGKPRDGLTTCAAAIRLNPRPPHWYFWMMGMAQFAAGQYEEAISSLSREETYGTGSREVLVPALALSGRVSEAREEGRLLLASIPNWRISELAEALPFENIATAQPFIDGWRLAGLPE